MPSLYYANYIAKNALLVPEHIIELVEQQVEDGTLDEFFEWRPCDNAYSDLTGEAPPVACPFLKQLVGFGPFVFDYYDRDLASGLVTKYNEFFINAPRIGPIVGEWRIDPGENYTYKPLVQNVAAKEANENGTLADVTVNVKIYEDACLPMRQMVCCWTSGIGPI